MGTRAAGTKALGAGIAAMVLAVAAVGIYFVVRRPPDPRRDACIAATGKMLANTQGDVRIEAYVTGGSPRRDKFLADLRDLLQRYERAGQGRLRFTLVDARSDEDLRLARDAGLQEMALGEPGPDGKEAVITRGVAGLVVKIGAEKEAIPALSIESPVGLPFWITNKIREVRARAEHRTQRIGLYSSKGGISIAERDLVPAAGGGSSGPSLRSVLEQALPFYTFEDVDLKGGEAAIDPDLGALIITQPGQDLTDRELARIDELMMRGNKRLAVFASAVNVSAGDAAMKAHLSAHGLEKLLDGYGVEMKRDVVLDGASSYEQPFAQQGATFVAPALVRVGGSDPDKKGDGAGDRLDSAFVPFFKLDELMFPFASTLVPHPERQPSASVRIVARSSPEATADATEGISLAPSPRAERRGEPGQRALAIAVTGIVKSAFGAGTAEGTRILVLSSSQFTANPLVRAGSGPTPDQDLMLLGQSYAQKYLTETILGFKNTLDWMGDDEYISACSVL
jgi:ABC-type uncharacterized transport system